MQFLLELCTNGVAGRVLRLLPGTYVVGREPNCQIRIAKRAVSRRHCVLTVGLESASVRDLGSRSGTYLNARLVADAQPLRDGDRLAVCGVTLRVRVLSDSAPSDPAWCSVLQSGPGIVVDPDPAPRPNGQQASG